MPLRWSAARTPALVAAHRRNVQHSAGRRSAYGKAWPRRYRLRNAVCSPEYHGLSWVLVDMMSWPVPARVQGRRASQGTRQRCQGFAESGIGAEAEIGPPRTQGTARKNKNNTSFKAGMLLKTKSEKNKPRGDPNIWLKPNPL